MPRFSPVINTFTSGELAPVLHGRIDVKQYFSGASTLENILIKPYGGAVNRPGTYYVSEVKDSDKEVRLIPFEFSTEQAYVIEVGEEYMRFYKDDGQILLGGVPYEIATPYSEDEIFDLQFAQSADVLYIVHENHAPRKLTRTGHTAWTLTEIDYTETNNRAPLRDENITAITITPSADAGAGITITASEGIFYPDMVGGIWKIKDGYVEIKAVAGDGVVAATADVLYSGNLNTGPGATTEWAEGAWSEYRGYPKTISFYERRLVFGGSTGEPQTVWLSVNNEFENMETGSDDDDGIRFTIAAQNVNAIQWLSSGLVLAIGTTGGEFTLGSGSSSEPLTPSLVVVKRQSAFGSKNLPPIKIGNLTYYMQSYGLKLREFFYNYEIDGYRSVDATILSSHITESGIVDMAYQQHPHDIIWCVREDGEIATFIREIDQDVKGWTRQVTDGDFESVAIIPTTTSEEDQVWVIVKRYVGGNYVRYVEYFKPQVFDQIEDAFFVDSGVSLDDPLTITGITAAEPPVVTSVAHGLSDGDIVRITEVEGMTELNRQKFKVANKTDDTFELTDLEDVNIDASDYTAYVSGGEIRECFNTFSGLDHLEGETVRVLVDGATHEDQVVSGGSISLDDYYGHVHAGLGYDGIIESLNIEGGSAMGSSQGKIGAVLEATIRFYKSLGCKIGTNSGDVYEVPFRTTEDEYGNAPEAYTGDKRITFPGGHTRDKRVYIKQDRPLPMYILGVFMQMRLSE